MASPGDAAKELIAFWRQVVPETGELVHDFTDATWNTRFLGPVPGTLRGCPQALCPPPDSRVRRGVYPRPHPRTGHRRPRPQGRALIDPTCGSRATFCSGRSSASWINGCTSSLARRAGAGATRPGCCVWRGCQPHAVAIARFRLLVAALQASQLTTLRHAPGFRLNVAVGDSLLHGRRFDELDLKGRHGILERLKGSGTRMASKTWRLSIAFWGSSTMWWGIRRTSRSRIRAEPGIPQALLDLPSPVLLAVPFTERFFDLAVYGPDPQPAGMLA